MIFFFWAAILRMELSGTNDFIGGTKSTKKIKTFEEKTA